MKLAEHILYQRIIAEIKAYPAILNVFENTLHEKGIAISHDDKREEYEKFCIEGCLSKTEYDRAVTLAAFFEYFSDEEINEYINLGRKEKIARTILRDLNEHSYNIDQIHELLSKFSKIPAGKIHLPTTMTLNIRVNLISQFISSQLEYISIAKNHINMRDMAEVLDHSIATQTSKGTVGGKSAGMILANRILSPSLSPRDKEFDGKLAETDSYYIKSSVINEFVAFNHLHECHSLKYFDAEDFEREHKKLEKRFLAGRFKKETLKKFREILEKTKDSPLVIRSSSLLEDSIGCSFSGKYDSLFISNTGTMKERLEEFTNALKKVYFSLYNADAIEYRRDNHLLDYNEKMAILVQKVVGKAYGKYFFPAISIVGFSQNPYCWNKRIKKEDGMLRMEMGLGTRAVERAGDDYPRIVSLSAPQLRPEVTEREKIRYSQKFVDVLNLETKQLETVHFVDLLNHVLEIGGQDFPMRDIISVESGGVLSRPIIFPDRLIPNNCAITFDGLLADQKFSSLMKHVLDKLEESYKMPVDMEFAYQDGKLYVLQCRSLSQQKNIVSDVKLPNIAEEKVLFTLKDCFRSAFLPSISHIIYIDKVAYDNLENTEEKFEVARIVGKLNRAMADKRHIMIGPGRWGTNSLDLGVGVRYGDINHTLALVEIAWEKDGITPELSYGTHFFQDLVEADIIPLPLYPNKPGEKFNLKFIKESRNCASDIVHIDDAYKSAIKVVDINKETNGELLNIYLDDKSGKGLACFL